MPPRPPPGPSMTGYKPTVRDRIGAAIAGDERSGWRQRLAEGAVGSSGVGYTGNLNLADMTGLGLLMTSQESGRDMGSGHPLRGAANLAMALPIAAPALKGAKALAKGAGKAIERAAPPIRAYHGTPHQFDRFSMDKIGTGEGAQVYGHGLYFAENEDVARGYRDTLKWKGTDWDNPESVASFWLERNKGDAAATKLMLASTADQARKYPKNFPDAASNRAVEDAIALLDSGYTGRGPESPGHMYEVGIHAQPEQFLDWEAPLSAHGETVKSIFGAPPDLAANRARLAELDALRPFNDSAEHRRLTDEYVDLHRQRQVQDPRGASLYRKFIDQQGNPAGASQALREAGVPGIKYFDQGSRAAGDGTRNFVMFDDRMIDILRRYGIAAPTMTGAAAVGYGATQNQGTR